MSRGEGRAVRGPAGGPGAALSTSEAELTAERVGAALPEGLLRDDEVVILLLNDMCSRPSPLPGSRGS